MTQPLVRRHPVMGRPSLFICPAVISHMEGLPPDEGHALIAGVMAHAAADRTVYRHR